MADTYIDQEKLPGLLIDDKERDSVAIWQRGAQEVNVIIVDRSNLQQTITALTKILNQCK